MSTIKKPTDSNFMVLTFNVRYDDNIVLPYKDGIAVLSALENAKIYTKPYNAESSIRDVKADNIKTSSIGAQEYGEAILRATLLGEEESQ